MDIVKVRYCGVEVEAQRIGYYLVHRCCQQDVYLIRHAEWETLVCGLPHELAIAGADAYSTYGVATPESINQTHEKNNRICAWLDSCRDNIEVGDDYPSYRDWHTSMYGEPPQAKLVDIGLSGSLGMAMTTPSRNGLN